MLAFAPNARGHLELTWWWETRHTHWWHTRHSTHWTSREPSIQVLLEQWICLSFCIVCVRDTVDNLLGLVARDLLVVGLNIAEVVAAVVVRLPHAHTIVGEIDIAVIAEELRHRGAAVVLKAVVWIPISTYKVGSCARVVSASQELEECRA